MSLYVTLDDERFEIDDLSSEDSDIYKSVQELLSQSPKPGWVDFSNSWTRLVVSLYGEVPEITKKSIYKICQDLECRLGIEQGFIEPGEVKVTERGEMEKLAQCLNWFDRGPQALGHKVINPWEERLIIEGDRVRYTKEEAIEECQRRITWATKTIETFKNEIAQMKEKQTEAG